MEPNQSSPINYTALKLNHLHPKKKLPFLVLFSCAFFIGNAIGLIFFVTRVNQKSSGMTSSVKAAVNEDSRPDAVQIIATSSSTSSKLKPQEPDIYGTTMKFTSYRLGISLE